MDFEEAIDGRAAVGYCRGRGSGGMGKGESVCNFAPYTLSE